ncbi:MAG TPA: FtsX-like permease family protein, partial [Magnetospirillum sp.]|nr:FtsX-like permease family protein [Magnetospirillum sp.]
TYARRELRGGIKGFRILMACLALGVAAIAASGSLRAAFHTALKEDSRKMLGGDLDLRQSYRPIDAEQRAALSSMGTLSEGLEMRAMARSVGNESRRLVELKGVDGAYPLAGTLELDPPMPVDQALARRDGILGAVADPNLMFGLGLKLGDVVEVGNARLQIRALIVKEPDRVATALAFGPRLMVPLAALPETGLDQPGSLIRWTYRLVLEPGITPTEAKARLGQRFPEAGWQLRDTSDAAPGVGRFLDNLAAFLTLVGLTALLVGGIGVANSVKAYLDGRTPTIAVLKSVGAPSRLIFATYASLVALLAGIGIVAGLAVGAAVPLLVVKLAGDKLPLAARIGLYPGPLAVAAGFGVLTASVFTLWPLARAKMVPATALFRQAVVPLARWPDRRSLVVMAVAALGLMALAIGSAERPGLAAAFVAAALATLALFRGLAAGLSWAAARLSARRTGVLAHPTGRLALANLHRPGSAVVSVVLSLGLGLTVLVAIALIEGNLARQFGERLPAEAPSFFFIDIQPDQREDFARVVRSIDPSARIDEAPMVRGRITRINGVPVAEAVIAPEAEWAIRGDRGLTAAATPPKGTRLVEGKWWAEDYAGPPLASVDATIAKGFGLKLGDSLGINVLGREMEVRIASLRDIEWSTLNMNFTFILPPNALAGAPHTWIATVHAAESSEAAIEKAVTDRLANVSAIRVKEALMAVREMIANADMAVRLAALVTLTAGALVLAGAVMAGHRRRVYEAVVLKVLGATRADLWRAWLLEFGIVGLSTGLFAGLIGATAAWAILVFVMHADWVLLPGIAATTVAACVAASLLAGFAGTFAAMRAKAAPLLRGE